MQTQDKPIYMQGQKDRNSDLQILSIKPNKAKESNGMYVKGTTEDDVELFDRLVSNIHRADVQTTTTTLTNGRTKRIEEHLDFEVKMVAALTTETSDQTTKKHFGRRITIVSPKALLKRKKIKIEVLWNIDINDIEKYDIDNKIKLIEQRKKSHAEKLGISQSELNNHKLLSKMDDLDDVQMERLLEFMGNL